MKSQEWISRPEGGGPRAIRMMVSLARTCGRSFSRVVLYPITLYFVLRRRPERRASSDYLRRLAKGPNWLNVARHIYCFAAVTLDRVYLLAENFRRFDVRCYGMEDLTAALGQDKGVLLFGAHVGSFDVLRALGLQRPDLEFRAVIDIGQNPALSAILKSLNPQLAATIINSRREGVNTAFDIQDALNKKAIVSMLVDRARPDNAVAIVDFLGAPASFPTGPWLLAAALKVPVVICFGLYRGANRYEIYFETFADLDIPRAERDSKLKTTISRYAKRLEHYVRIAPYNWFNFYDFWQA
jgi:predicted LPLAT superfamily acyltransferase